MLLIGAAVLGCGPQISDTGYTGTWARGSERSRSTIAIHREGDRYLFRWKVDSPDGKWRVRCDWNGQCEEQVEGEKTSEYRFTTRTDPATGHLLVQCTGRVTKPKQLDISYLDELVVEPGGRVLWSYTLQRGGERFQGEARPKRSFDKVSDEVGELPPQALE
ncbi:MAG TPA: hypothetical protein VFV75_21190 [Candidatus Polarisedimenticolaceae bacterium]|nr:hypothetical protein [Candidatus Polarisedimenticolaceae bacterium]